MEFHRPRTLKNVLTHYCPGCGHGIVHRLVAEAIDELGIRERTIGTAPVGCAVLFYNYFDCDIIECAHGRPPAVATGMKRMLPDRIIFTYQGDGDLAAIGTTETIHAANRGENITVIFVNNAIYGMTGGQMAPTTIKGQWSTTTPEGRGKHGEGGPIRICEMLSALDGPSYLERVAVSSPKDILRAKKAVKKAFEKQIAGKGFSLVEVLSMCPTDWKLTPAQAVDFVNEKMKAVFPLGVFRDR
ncbi:MAG TPA: thiamine pyrophosphate-dependent enzyme [Anaerohalosphaeraceae bacterium]|jgi:2-oxoglutarate ferredoxin oxidoreductase subunit beta|nr:thiamine pyrophosphate-dependent enzyme [Anaerohalosphaeraceae bacterium]HQG05682.1 thiamine pyrophosphate-dependent enzyme [Anaerohalosphaeraceae bacterium]HQI07055.1 thiamine pyrophosphate-dependent enzyme [Anaerohalosphaeraceae bacterium]HQJ67015.1 thiamine pyrophosphate-dependent enzyme [Anaerohalosphaeraceae bacterium]